MANENWIGLIFIVVVSFICSIILFMKYFENKNHFTYYMALFFLLMGIGSLIRLITTEIFLNIYDITKDYIMVIGIIPQVILLLFVLAFFETPKALRIIVILIELILVIIHFINPTIQIFITNAAVIIFINSCLFILTWRRNDDVKSLMFAISLVILMFGEMMASSNHLIHGIMLIIVAMIWIITYFGILEKFTS